ARDHRTLHRRTDHLLRDRRVEHSSINTIIDPGTLSPEPSRRPPKQHLSTRLLVLRQRTPGRLQLGNSREVSHPIRLLQWYETTQEVISSRTRRRTRQTHPGRGSPTRR